ncbi:3647_t:CDS:2 [Racocetra fulgida]|uniref:3647_t:CDS:1 n=1 Tax=Racocetra fulgida TaxID=60492 RepID=A0A9N9AJG3_9GLOM|nr:3647_t:CDS:2 [Racocetra fulgida]
MLSKEILNKLRHSSYWERPYTQWTINTWDNFHFINYPDKPKVSSHRDLGKELKVLVELLRKKGESVSTKASTERERLPEEDPVISITTSINNALENSLPEIVLNTIPNLVYLNLRDKSNSTNESTEQRFPDEITNWLEFEQEVRTWQPEADKKYQKPTFRTRKITCEKDIWSATDVNICDALTPLDRPIFFWMAVL